MTDATHDLPAPTHRKADTAVHAHDDHDDHGAHPTESAYWKVFVVLAVLTAVEVLWSYLGLEGPSLVVPLLLMMLVKFCIVGGAFMHLYYDLNIRNGYWFTLAFGGAILVAVLVYLVVFATFSWQI